MRIKGPRAFLLAPAAAAVVFGATLVQLGRTGVHHSPLHRPESGTTPHQEALEEAAEWRRNKAEEGARRAELLKSLTTEKMVELGREIVHGRGLCFNCHRVGAEGAGTQGPDLAGVGARAGTRVPGLSDADYLAQSLYRPDAYVVEGFSPAMVPADQPPIGLDDLEIRMVIAYLQSLGGTPTIAPGEDPPSSTREGR